MKNKYPTVYFQMKAMIKWCEKGYNKIQNKSYVDFLILELKTRCQEIELEIEDQISLEAMEYDCDKEELMTA
jgi:hypothetical protein